MIDQFVARLEELHGKHFCGDEAHGLQHARRVNMTAQIIARSFRGVDIEVLTAAAYLHDIYSPPKNSSKRSTASSISAELASEIAQPLFSEPFKIEQLRDCILCHAFSQNKQATRVEAKILQDADRIDALGSVGMARLFYTAGNIGSDLIHPFDPFGVSRKLDEKMFALDHFLLKLIILPELMSTECGKRIAKRRLQSMCVAMDELLEEVIGHGTLVQSMDFLRERAIALRKAHHEA